MKRATRCLILLAVAFSLLLFTVVPRYDLLDSHAPLHVLQKRQEPSTNNPAPTTATPTPTSPPTAPASTNNQPTNTQPTQATTAPQTSNTPTQTTQQPTTQPQTTTAAPSPQQQTTAAPISNTSLTTPTSVATDSQGQTQTITETSTSATDSASHSATSAPSSGNSPPSGGGLGTGSIIGLSVAGGVALIGIIGFFIWKFTRKRFTDFDDNEAIKWPELNTHGEGSTHHALPTNSTGRSGVGDDGDGLSRAPSSGYANSVAAGSAHELFHGGGTDPYAVPPLPHLNPNQPYHDDPNYSQTEFYDPYRGPVPDSMSMDGHPGAQGYSGEVIPMTQMAGRRSPGPGMAYDVGRSSPVPATGRQSPGPQMMMDDRSRSPGPSMGVVPGRLASPAPHQPYVSGYDTRY